MYGGYKANPFHFGYIDFLFVPFAILLVVIVIEFVRGRDAKLKREVLYGILLYHLFFTILYWYYSVNNVADARGYYDATHFSEYSWIGTYINYPYSSTFYGTRFVQLLLYPFSNTLGLSYFSCFLIFTLFGFLGYIFLYKTITENLTSKSKLGPLAVFPLLLFLPGMHFWTTAIGKDSFIFWGIGLLFYGLSKPKRRKKHLFLALIIIICIRPHVLVAITVCLFIALLIDTNEIKPLYRFFIFLLGCIIAVAVYPIFMQFLRLDSLSWELILQKIENQSGHAEEADTHISMVGKSSFERLIIYFFRPLFFDAHNLNAIISSFENLLLLVLTIFTFLRFKFFTWVKRSGLLVKFSFLYFLIGGAFMSSFTNTFGVAVRQKNMILPGLLILIVLFFDHMHSRKIYRRRQYLNG